MSSDDQDAIRVADADGGDPAAFPARLAAVIGPLSVRAFARRAGVSDTFLRQCLAGRTEPTRPKLLAIARAGGVSVEWLATGGNAGAPQPMIAEERGPARRLLERIIETVEQALDDSGRAVSPAQKARLVSALYDLHAGSHEDSISRAAVRNLVDIDPKA